MKTIDAMGKVCPVPVIMTKKALRENAGADDITVKVDNEIATQNLSKLAKQMNIKSEVKKISDASYEVVLSAKGQCAACTEMENPINAGNNGFVVVISSEQMGTGDEEFGKKLLENFIYSLSEQDELPKKIIFYNSGVKLPCLHEKAINDLKAIEKFGTEILACGLCLDFYHLKEKLQVGSVTNMYRITEIMRSYYTVKPC